MREINLFEFAVAVFLLGGCAASNILLWIFWFDQEPNFDVLGASFGALQIFLIVVAVGGYWQIRSYTKEVVTEVAEAEAQKIVEDIAPSAARDAAIAWLEDYYKNRGTNGEQISDEIANDIANAMVESKDHDPKT